LVSLLEDGLPRCGPVDDRASASGSKDRRHVVGHSRLERFGSVFECTVTAILSRVSGNG
jgi:hypothetical protein